MGNQKSFSDAGDLGFDADLFKKDPFTVDKPSFRPEKIAHRLRDELLLMVPDELANPKLKALGTMTITTVKCTKDLRNATVGFALNEDLFIKSSDDESISSRAQAEKQKRAEAYLNQAAGYLRHLLAERMGTKHTPILCFKYDRGTVHSQKIDALLTHLKK